LAHIRNIEKLRKEYAEKLEKEVGVLDSYKQKLSPKEEKKNELRELKGENQELEVKLIETKKGQLEKLKDEFVEKGSGFFRKKKEKLQDNLRIYLNSVKRQDDDDLKFAGEKAKK